MNAYDAWAILRRDNWHHGNGYTSPNRPETPPCIVERAPGERDGDYALRRAAAYTLRDNQRNVADMGNDPRVPYMLVTIDRAGYPPDRCDDTTPVTS